MNHTYQDKQIAYQTEGKVSTVLSRLGGFLL